MQFSPFFGFLSREKCNFHRFLLFSRGRNAIFTVFWFSLQGEMQFSPFSGFLSGEKCNFHRFLVFSPGRNAIFAVFCFSLRGETRFSPFSAFRGSPKHNFRMGRELLHNSFCSQFYFNHLLIPNKCNSIIRNVQKEVLSN